MPRLLVAAFAALLAVPALQAQTDELRRVVLIDGSVLVGFVEDETADPVVILSESGVEQRVPRAQIATIAPLIDGRFFRVDPTRTRLILTPTGRTLGAGRTRVGTLLYIIPQATVGLNDRVDLGGTRGVLVDPLGFERVDEVEASPTDVGRFSVPPCRQVGAAVA